MFLMLEVLPILLGWRFHSSICWHTSPASLTITSRCFDATRRLVSNKLEFAQFGAHMQKLWQFWFSVEFTCFRGSGIRMAPTVVPLGRSGSTAYRHKRSTVVPQR